jgi:hypothetical protein
VAVRLTWWLASLAVLAEAVAAVRQQGVLLQMVELEQLDKVLQEAMDLVPLLLVVGAVAVRVRLGLLQLAMVAMVVLALPALFLALLLITQAAGAGLLALVL